MSAEPPADIAAQGFSKSLDDCDQRIRDAFLLVRLEFCRNNTGHDLHVDYTYRAPALQFELFKKGRTLNAETGQWELTDRAARVTDKDGTIKKGEHNFYPSKAADIYIVAADGDEPRGFRILWGSTPEEQALYVALAYIWKAHGIASGALWASFKDWPHVQVS